MSRLSYVPSPSMVRAFVAKTARWLLSLFTWVSHPMRDLPPPRGLVRLGSLRRLSPISREWGFDRGTPIDRYYIGHFLDRFAGRSRYVLGDIRGHVMEIGGDVYTREYGGWGEPDSPVERVDIFHADKSNPEATIVGDLTVPEDVPENTFDCVICTQTLHVIYDVKTAIRSLHRCLKPDGVLLATLPGISQTAVPDIDLWGDYWRFTTRSARQLFEEVFPAEGLRIEAYGNVLAATGFLYGLAQEEFREEELMVHDPQYQLLIAVRAVKDA